MKNTGATPEIPPGGQTEQPRPAFFSDPSFLSLLTSNIFTLALGLALGWNVYPLMVVYWCQSVIIGLHNFKRMRLLKQFTAKNFGLNGRPVPETQEGSRSVANFFALHYGSFHFFYLIFLFYTSSGLEFWDYIGMAAAALSFFFNHRFSFLHNLERDLAGKPDIGILMGFPYVRIIPMHICIALAALYQGSNFPLVLFIALKTMADLAMHAIEHRKPSP